MVAVAANSAVIAVISACHVNSNNAKLYDSLVRSSTHKRMTKAVKGSGRICQKKKTKTTRINTTIDGKQECSTAEWVAERILEYLSGNLSTTRNAKENMRLKRAATSRHNNNLAFP